MKRSLSFWTLSMIWCVGCSDSDDPSHEESEDPAEHACEHAGEMSDGTPITAGATPVSAPALVPSEEPYLVDLEGSTGYLALTGPTDALLFVAQADAVTGLTFESAGADELPQGAPNEHCPALIPEHFDLELEEAGNYYLELTTANPPLWLVYTTAEGHTH